MVLNRSDIEFFINSPSWGQSNDFPWIVFCFSSVNESIMQSRGSTLPELNFQWNDSQATPIIWTWDVFSILETFGVFLGQLVQFFSVLDNIRLAGSPCTDLGSTRSRLKVSFRSFSVNMLCDTFNSHLPLQILPKEYDCRIRVGSNIMSLSRGSPVRINSKTSMVELLKKKNSGRHPPTRQFRR